MEKHENNENMKFCPNTKKPIGQHPIWPSPILVLRAPHAVHTEMLRQGVRGENAEIVEQVRMRDSTDVPIPQLPEAVQEPLPLQVVVDIRVCLGPLWWDWSGD